MMKINHWKNLQFLIYNFHLNFNALMFENLTTKSLIINLKLIIKNYYSNTGGILRCLPFFSGKASTIGSADSRPFNSSSRKEFLMSVPPAIGSILSVFNS